MKIRHHFTRASRDPFVDERFHRVAIEGVRQNDASVLAPAKWPLSVVETFACAALIKDGVPSARETIAETGVPPALSRRRPSDTSHDRPQGETDVRDAIDRVAGSLARRGLDLAYFQDAEQALTFHEELRAAVVLRRLTFASEIWQQVGADWAYGTPRRGDAARERQDQHPAATTSQLDAAALAMGRRILLQLARRLADSDSSNDAMATFLDAAEDHGLPASAAQLVADLAGQGQEEYLNRDAHLDADSSVWPALAAGQTTAPKTRLRRYRDEDLDELVRASFCGDAETVAFARHDRPFKSDDLEQAKPTSAIDVSTFMQADESGHLSVDLEGLAHTTRLTTIALDLALDSAGRLDAGRQVNIGISGMAELIMAHGVAYASDEGRAIAATIAAYVSATAICTSADLAEHLGQCAEFDAHRDAVSDYLQDTECLLLGRHGSITAPTLYPHSTHQARLLDAARTVHAEAVRKVEKYGLRSLTKTSICDDQTLNALLGADAAGLAPVRQLVQHRRLTNEVSDASLYKVISPAVPPALRALGYDDACIERILEDVVGRGTLCGAPGVNPDLLREKGVPRAVITRAQAALTPATSLRAVFSSYALGWEPVSDSTPDSISPTPEEDDLLQSLGFSEWDVAHADLYCCGAQTLEAASGLAREHLAVFDCAQPLGQIGTRCVSVHDRMLMAQAVQPFVTSPIILEIEMPASSDLGAIADVYGTARVMGLTAIRVDREGTDLTTPLDYDDLREALLQQEAETDDLNPYVRSIESDQADMGLVQPVSTALTSHRSPETAVEGKPPASDGSSAFGDPAISPPSVSGHPGRQSPL